MLFKLNNSISGESGYYYEMNDGSVVNGMKQSVDNLHSNSDDVCGSEFLSYNQIGDIMSDKGINEFNCLFSLQSSELYSNVPGDKSVSNILTLDFTTVPDLIDYNVEDIMSDLLDDAGRRRRLAASDVINETSM